MIRSEPHLSRRSEHNSSNLALVIVVSICLGPSAVAVMNGKLPKRKEDNRGKRKELKRL